jgi:hypothetical protein
MAPPEWSARGSRSEAADSERGFDHIVGSLVMALTTGVLVGVGRAVRWSDRGWPPVARTDHEGVGALPEKATRGADCPPTEREASRPEVALPSLTLGAERELGSPVDK